MPRIPTSLLRKAHAIDALLPALLAPCRDLCAAQSELRWLREHAVSIAEARRARGDTVTQYSLLRHLVNQRASGKPLQYILGTEFFGDLEIQCRPGVLIPRQDTAASVTHLVRRLRGARDVPTELRLLDLCTGTGCIPLLFRHELYSARDDIRLHALAVDLSDQALALARYNLAMVDNRTPDIRHGRIDLLKADVLIDSFTCHVGDPLPLKAAMIHKNHPLSWDILISNPPYISPSNYWKTTTRSVRGYEPKLALVPPQNSNCNDTEQGDMFYSRLLAIARDVDAKIVLLEVADLQQAHRVAQHAHKLNIFDGIEIWREEPTAPANSIAEATDVLIIGEGNARSVLCWRGVGSSWLGKAAATDGM